MRFHMLVALFLALAANSRADILYNQLSPVFAPDSQWFLDNSSALVWDDFTLASAADIGRIRWNGTGYPPHISLSISRSLPGGLQPDIDNPLTTYLVGPDSHVIIQPLRFHPDFIEYDFKLPTPFHVDAATKYWLHIEGTNTSVGVTWYTYLGSGGDGMHYKRVRTDDESFDGLVPEDLSFSLSSTPESSTAALLVIGCVVALVVRRR